MLSKDQQFSDDLAELGALAKLRRLTLLNYPLVPLPQLKACIKELQKAGFNYLNTLNHLAIQRGKNQRHL